MDFLVNHIEALIFCSPTPVKEEDISMTLSEMLNADVPEEDVSAALSRLQQKYESSAFSFSPVRLAGGFQFMTKPEYQNIIGVFLRQQSKKQLSASAMETLAIIAYKQPVTKSEVEQIRGVSCDYAVQKLLEKELIEIKGKSDGIGRPLLYGTSRKFEEHFGINSLKDLPTPKDFSSEENEIGDEK